MEKNSLGVLKLFLLFGSSVSGLVVGFLPLYFQEQGLSNSDIGLFIALGTFVGLIAQPAWGILSDKFKTVKRILNLCLLGLLLGIIWLFQIHSLLWIFIAGSFFYFFYSAINPLSDNLSKRTADQRKIEFGSIRSWNSFGFAFISLISGFYFSKFGMGHFSIPMIVIALLALVLSFYINDVDTGTKKLNLKEVGQVFKNPTLLTFFLFTSFISITHRVNDSFVSLYLFDIGGNEMLVGWLWFIAVLSEALVFLFSVVWFRAAHPIKYIIFAGFLYGTRWVITGLIDSPIALLSTQVLHGICFGVLFLGALEYLYKIVPQEMQATGHMVFMGFTFMITGIIGSSVGGIIFDAFGGPALYFTLAASAFIGMICFIFFHLNEKKKNQLNLAKG